MNTVQQCTRHSQKISKGLGVNTGICVRMGPLPSFPNSLPYP